MIEALPLVELGRLVLVIANDAKGKGRVLHLIQNGSQFRNSLLTTLDGVNDRLGEGRTVASVICLDESILATTDGRRAFLEVVNSCCPLSFL